MSDLVGQMKRKVQLCLNVPSSQGAGYTDSYGILLTTRGKLEQSSGNRSLVYGEIEGRSSHTLTVRYQRAIETNISVSSKWLIDGVFYTIDSWEKIGDENFYYKFRVNKKEPAAGSGVLQEVTGSGLQAPLYLTTTAGATSIDMGVTPSEVLLVAKSGSIFTKVGSNPASFEFSVSGSVLTFGVTFNADEIVYVLYKMNT